MSFDSLWPNLLLFALAQVVAWGFLRTGLVVRGVALMATTWIGADIALLARFVWGHDGPAFWLPLLVYQVHALVEAALFIHGQVRRRSPSHRERRRKVYREAFAFYLNDDLEPARQRWRRLVWADPWDLESTIAWATVLVRQGRPRPAQLLLWKARWLDGDERFRDVIAEELERCRKAIRSRPRAEASTTAGATAKPASGKAPPKPGSQAREKTSGSPPGGPARPSGTPRVRAADGPPDPEKVAPALTKPPTAETTPTPSPAERAAGTARSRSRDPKRKR